jgi:hypothetical protein
MEQGGIMCGWRSDYITTSNVSRLQFSLTLEVHLRWDQSSFWLIVVYGPVDDAGKPGFLAEIASIKPPGSTLWVVMGDFNLI